MAYKLASGISAGRRLGDKTSGPRTIGYDANPRVLRGTTEAASDYKRKKGQKQKDKQVQLEETLPYNDSYYEGSNGIWYTTNSDDTQYLDNKVLLGKGVEGSKGYGWILSLRMSEYKKIEVITGTESSFFYIQDVSDKGQIKLPTAPLENGMVKHDHKVVMPKTLRISGYVSREDTETINSIIEYAELSKSLGTYFSLVSPWRSYPKMYLKEYSSKASNKKYDVYDYTLDLQELLIAKDLKDTTDNPELSSNENKGSVSGS